MMRVPIPLILALALGLLAPSCKTRKPVNVDTSEVSDIPRDVALQKLRELLPTAEFTYCTVPKESLKPSEIKVWTVRGDAVEIDFGKGKNLVLPYATITKVTLELVGKFYTARVYTSVQPDEGKDHFQFLWKLEDPAKRVVELLTSLKGK